MIVPDFRHPLRITRLQCARTGLLFFALFCLFAVSGQARRYRVQADFTGEGQPTPSWPDVCGAHAPLLQTAHPPDYYVPTPVKEDTGYPPGYHWRYFLRCWPHHTWNADMDVTADRDREAEATLKVLGPFSGRRRWYDFTIATESTDNLLEQVRKGHRLGYETSPLFGNRYAPLTVQALETTKDLFYWTVRYFNEQRQGGKPILHWRFGLEMNGRRHHFLPGKAKQDLGVWQKFNAPEVADTYVRQLLAPGAEAVERASRDVYGDPDRIKVVLGTVNGLNNPPAMRFMDRILNYKLSGTTAPSFAGDPMWKHVDILSGNFFMSTSVYRQRLDYLYDAYIRSGKAEGIWVTELGYAGKGAWHVVQTASRFLDWTAGRRPRERGAFRIFYWGETVDHPCGPATVALKYLGDLFRNRAIRTHTEATQFRCGTDMVPELYSFAVSASPTTVNYLLCLFPHEDTYPVDIMVDGAGSDVFPATPEAEVRLWPEDAPPRAVAPDTTRRDHRTLHLTFEGGIEEDTLMTVELECRRRIYTCRHTTASMSIDGALDERVWDQAEAVKMVRRDGCGAPERPSLVRFLWSDTHLFVAAECRDPDIWATLEGRDNPLFKEEVVEFFFKPARTSDVYFEYEINPLGSLFDARLQEGKPRGRNRWKWDAAGAEVAVDISGTVGAQPGTDDGDDRWVTEFAVPFAAMAQVPSHGTTWKMNAGRIERPSTDNGDAEFTAWAPTFGSFHKTTFYGALRFVK